VTDIQTRCHNNSRAIYAVRVARAKVLPKIPTYHIRMTSTVNEVFLVPTYASPIKNFMKIRLFTRSYSQTLGRGPGAAFAAAVSC